MKYARLSPHPDLACYIESFVFLRASGQDVCPSGMCLPNGHSALVIHLKQSFLRIDDERLSVLPDAFFVGQLVSGQLVEPMGEIDCVLVLFQPTALFRLFGLDMTSHRFLSHIDAASLDLPGFPELVAALHGLHRQADRKAAIESYVRNRLGTARRCCAYVDQCIAIIRREQGRTTIASLATRCGVSPRELRAQFIKQVGLSPKQFARIVRVNAVLARLSTDTKADWRGIVYALGYCDQAHFIRDFRAVTGVTPTAYLKQDIVCSQMLSGQYKPGAQKRRGTACGTTPRC